MNVKTIANTNQLPSATFLGVRAHEEADAIAEILAIALRRGLQLTDTVYRWGGVYFYAPIVTQ